MLADITFPFIAQLFAKFCQKKILRAQWPNLYQSGGIPQGKFDFEEILFRAESSVNSFRKKLISQI